MARPAAPGCRAILDSTAAPARQTGGLRCATARSKRSLMLAANDSMGDELSVLA